MIRPSPHLPGTETAPRKRKEKNNNLSFLMIQSIMIPCVKYTLKKNKLDKPKHKNDIKIREMFKLPSDWLFLLICFMIGGGGLNMFTLFLF